MSDFSATESRDISEETLTLLVCRSLDGRTCIYLNDKRIAGGKPAIGKNVIDNWNVNRSDLLEILGVRQ